MRAWTSEQLSKWRIRKAQPEDPRPWTASCAVRHFDDHGRPVPCPWDLPPPPWWVWRPGSTQPEACYSTREHAQEYIDQSIKIQGAAQCSSD